MGGFDKDRYGYGELEQFDPYWYERMMQQEEEADYVSWYPCETCGESEELTCQWSEEKQVWLCSQCGRPVELVEDDEL